MNFNFLSFIYLFEKFHVFNAYIPSLTNTLCMARSFQVRQARQIHSRTRVARPTINHKHLSFTTNESTDKIVNISPTLDAIRYQRDNCYAQASFKLTKPLKNSIRPININITYTYTYTHIYIYTYLFTQFMHLSLLTFNIPAEIYNIYREKRERKRTYFEYIHYIKMDTSCEYITMKNMNNSINNNNNKYVQFQGFK